ncbi:hypothetical protein NDA16_004263 [Ustilago loliicola]|nr:hypothetical protein NDA16_004263 [Ustilago loliicola]
MIMSPPVQVDPLAVFLSDSAKASSSSCGIGSITSLKSSNIGKSSPRLTAAERAIRQLSLKSADSDLSTPLLSSSSRPLQPVDTNIIKAERQEVSRPRSSSSTPSPKLSALRTSATKKVRSPSSKDIFTGTRSAAKVNKLGSVIGSSASVTLKGDRISVKVPQKLPTPRLTPRSSPYEDLVAHLSRHHLFAESKQVEQYSIPPDYLLTQYLDLAHLGKCSLYHQTRNFLHANSEIITEHVKPGQSLPASVPLDVTNLVTTLQVPPTHLLAVHSDNQEAKLYVVHGLVLALQCVSIPFLPASNDRQEDGKVIKDMATLALRIPSLQHFDVVLRWLYSQSTTSLLHELLPIKHIVTYLTRRNIAKRKATGPENVKQEEATAASVDVSKLSTLDLVGAMSTLSTKIFLELLQTIQAVWKNGVALGIVSWNFWTQLDNAWNLIIGAMVASKRRSQKKMAAVAAATANELTAQLQSTRIE